MESKGLVVIKRDKILKVTFGARMEMKGIKKNNFYYFQRSIVIKAATITSSDDKLDSNTLWHMWLRHASEKSLQILVM